MATTADHETLAVRYVSEDEAATVKSSLTKQFTSAGWTQDTAKAEYSLFTKGNESASFVVEPSAGTAGSTIYIWS